MGGLTPPRCKIAFRSALRNYIDALRTPQIIPDELKERRFRHTPVNMPVREIGKAASLVLQVIGVHHYNLLRVKELSFKNFLILSRDFEEIEDL